MAFYLQVPNIKGSVTDSQHKDWIAVHTINFDTYNAVSVVPGRANDRNAGIPSVSDFIFTKLADVASPKLMASSLSGQVYDTIVIHVCNSSKKTFVEYTLHKAVISHYDMNASNSENISHTRLKETFAVNATKVEMRYLPNNGTPFSTSYDQETVTLA